MIFRPGDYEVLVATACARRLERFLRLLPGAGLTGEEFIDAIDWFRIEIGGGRDIPDLKPLAYPDEFSVTIKGYVVHVSISERQRAIVILDLEDDA